jgi:hypothetical protein
VVAPGRYAVVLEAGATRQEAGFAVVKDPRVKVSQRAFDQQLALLQALYGKLASLNDAVNRLRSIKRQLGALEARLGTGLPVLRDGAAALVAKLGAIEAVLVDVKRESPRDVLRHPAGLNDTIVDLISVVAIADEAPTTQARQVADETFAQVDDQLARLDALLAADVPAFNADLRAAGVEVIGPPAR